jgi:RNA ligase (TIGR02306 family)
VLPEWLLKSLGFWDDMNGKGKLSGGAGNRVRAIKLRGVLSQGILLDGDNYEGDWVLGGAPTEVGVPLRDFNEGDDAAEFLGITKFEPKVPAQMAGKVAGGDLEATIGFDFENLKKCPSLFEDGIDVVITEKIHGTLLQVGIVPRRIWEGKSWADKCPDVGDGFKGIVTSKGQGAKGLMLDPSDTTNLYVKAAIEAGMWEKLQAMRTEVLGHPDDMPLFIFGEIFGIGVQDLGYGQEKPGFRAFDIYAGTRSNGFYLTHDLLVQCLGRGDLPMVPQLYRGPFSAGVVKLHTDGNTIINGVKQIREGVVVKAAHDTNHPRYGRRIAKSVSEAYLLRKGEVTEYQ